MKGYIDPQLLEPIIENIFLVRENDNQIFQLEAVLDTAFLDYLCVPTYLVEKCQLQRRGTRLYELGDGSFVEEIIYLATIKIENEVLKIPITTRDGNQALLGTKLLDQKILTLDFKKYKISVED